MTTRRVSLVTALSKVYSSSRNSSTLNLLRNLSIATERSDFQQDLNGYHQIDNSLEYNNQNPPTGFYSETQNPFEFQQETTNGQSLNPNGGFRESPRNGQNGNFSAGYGRNNNNNNGGDLQQNYSNGGGFHRESFRSENKKDGVGQKGNFIGHYGQNNNGELQRYPSDYYNTRNVGVGVYQQSPPSPGQQYQQQNPTVHIGQYQQNQNVGQYQLSTNAKPEGEAAKESESIPIEVIIEQLDGFCKEGKVKEAVEVLGLLEKRGVNVDLPRYLQLMQMCGDAKALEEAKAVHKHIIRSLPPHLKVSTYNKILQMYAKCGSMDDAFNVFDKMPERNLTSWDTMITWLAKNGLGEDAIDLFTEFKKAGLKPDGEMFIGVFSACSVLGDIDEGMLYFEEMSKEFGIVPTMEHYVSVVDMLGSTGHLDEALEFIEKMPMEPSVDVWETLMNLCRVHGHLELGDRCAELVEKLDPSRLNEQSKAGLIPVESSDITKEKEKKTLAAQNPLEVRSRVHEYRAGDTSHPESDKIYAYLRGMKEQMKEAGYVPETRFVLHDIDQEGKEEALLAHSERLAVSFGLLKSPARSPLRIIKNLRVCGDCHTALKIISKIVGRELIIRDAKRFHHFKDGLCSCRDFW